MERPKLIAFDLDGTLTVTKERLSYPMGELLSELMEVAKVAIMSGASFKQFEAQVLPVVPVDAKLDCLYIFPTNAAQCYFYKDTKWQLAYDRSFNSLEKARIIQALNESVEETKFYDDPARPKEWGERIEDRGSQITFSALGQRAPAEAKKQWDPTRTKRKPLFEALLRRLPDFSVAMNANTSIDITPKGVNKAYGIRRLIEMVDISVSEMLYVGDALKEGGNDAVVKDTGIRTEEVFSPEETAELIKKYL